MRGSYPASENSLPTMQKERTYIFRVMLAAVFLAVVLVSCSKESSEPMAPTEIPLVFSPTAGWPEIANGSAASAGSGTKALITSASELQQYGISLFATASKNANTYAVFNNDLLKYSNSAWNYDITKYWIPGANYSFAAFAPYAGTTGEGVKLSNGTVTVSATATEPSITITDYNSGKGNVFDARCEDLLYAAYFRDNTNASDYSAVPLQFNHMMSCITFNIRNATNEDIISVTDIKLTGLLYKGSITYGTSGLSVEKYNAIVGESDNYFAGINMTGTTGAPFLPKGMSEQQAKPLFDCTDLTVLPQNTFGKNYSGNDINITLSFRVHYTANDAGVEYTGNLSNIDNIPRWEAGKKYKYNITISSIDITFQVQEIPWIKHEVEL